MPRRVVAAIAVLAVLGACAPDDTSVDGSSTTDAPTTDDAPTLEADRPDGPTDDRVEQEREAQRRSREQLAALASRTPGDPRAMGAIDAPVVLIQWASFLCPYCRAYSRDIEPELVERYVDAGLLRIEWRDLPVGGDDALLLAVGGRAAAEQDAFWAYHRVVFDAGLRRGDERIRRDWIIALAAELGLDTRTFAADLDREDLAADVADEADQARSIGIDVTPGFVIGGYVLQGEVPLDELMRVVEFAALDADARVP